MKMKLFLTLASLISLVVCVSKHKQEVTAVYSVAGDAVPINVCGENVSFDFEKRDMKAILRRKDYSFWRFATLRWWRKSYTLNCKAQSEYTKQDQSCINYLCYVPLIKDGDYDLIVKKPCKSKFLLKVGIAQVEPSIKLSYGSVQSYLDSLSSQVSECRDVLKELSGYVKDTSEAAVLCILGFQVSTIEKSFGIFGKKIKKDLIEPVKDYTYVSKASKKVKSAKITHSLPAVWIIGEKDEDAETKRVLVKKRSSSYESIKSDLPNTDIVSYRGERDSVIGAKSIENENTSSVIKSLKSGKNWSRAVIDTAVMANLPYTTSMTEHLIKAKLLLLLTKLYMYIKSIKGDNFTLQDYLKLDFSKLSIWSMSDRKIKGAFKKFTKNAIQLIEQLSVFEYVSKLTKYYSPERMNGGVIIVSDNQVDLLQDILRSVGGVQVKAYTWNSKNKKKILKEIREYEKLV